MDTKKTVILIIVLLITAFMLLTLVYIDEQDIKKNEITSKRYVGKVVDVTFKPATITTWATTVVTTDKGFFVLIGTKGLLLGDDVIMVIKGKYSSLCFDLIDTCHTIY